MIIDPTIPKWNAYKVKVVVYRDKNVGECSTKTTNKPTACWKTQKCVKFLFGHGGYSRRCGRKVYQKICNYQRVETCKFCTKSVLKTCYTHYSYNYHSYRWRSIRRCKNGHPTVNCYRKVNRRYVEVSTTVPKEHSNIKSNTNKPQQKFIEKLTKKQH